jgi:hypothetical protein
LQFLREEEKILFFTRLKQSTKGVGSVIGAVFVIFIILSGLTLYEVVLSNLNNYNTVASSMSQEDSNKKNEDLSTIYVEITSTNTLNITVQNTGSLQSTIIWLGLFNRSESPEGQWFYSISQTVNIGDTESFLSPCTVTSGQKYTVQIVTQRGNIYETTLNPTNQLPLTLSLIAGSPTIYQGNSMSIFLTITNNNAQTVGNITVNLLASPSNLMSKVSSPDSLSIGSLQPMQSKFLTWVYSAVNVGSIIFTVTYNQAPQGILATANVSILPVPTITPPPPAQGQVTITGIDVVSTCNPADWKELEKTSLIQGSIKDLFLYDSNTVAFSSYATSVEKVNKNIIQVEFIGSSDPFKTAFVCDIGSYWDTGDVAVTVQFYNFDLNSYVSSGTGYFTYTSSSKPEISQIKSFMVSTELEDLRDSSGQWRVKITGVKNTSLPFNFYIDWIDLELFSVSDRKEIDYGAWQNYLITSTSFDGLPTAYGYVSIYANGANLLLNAIDNSALTNPAWVQLDADGNYIIKIQSTNPSSQTIVISASVGTTVGQKTVIQEKPLQ